jgi:hypothetical protein
LEELDEVVAGCRFEGAWVQFFGEGEKRFRIFLEVLDFEHSLRVGKVVFLQIVIQTRAWKTIKTKDLNSSYSKSQIDLKETKWFKNVE